MGLFNPSHAVLFLRVKKYPETAEKGITNFDWGSEGDLNPGGGSEGDLNPGGGSQKLPKCLSFGPLVR